MFVPVQVLSLASNHIVCGCIHPRICLICLCTEYAWVLVVQESVRDQIVNERLMLSLMVCAYDAFLNDACMCHEAGGGDWLKHLKLVLCCRQVVLVGVLT